MEKKVVDSETLMTQMIMPNDANPLGNLMGGNLLRWMDIAAGICAGKHCEAHVATVSVDHVSFQLPIPVGEVISIKAVVTRAFNTSVEIYVEVFTATIKGQNPRRSNDAYFTFVAIDDDQHRPINVPAVLPMAAEETRRYESALRRRELRLLLGGRMKAKDANELKELFN